MQFLLPITTKLCREVGFRHNQHGRVLSLMEGYKFDKEFAPSGTVCGNAHVTSSTAVFRYM